MPRKTKESEKEKETLKNRLFPKKTNKSIDLEEPTEVSKKDNAKSTKSTSKKAVAQSKTTKKATKSVTKAKEAEKVTEKSTEKSKTTEKKKKATSSKSTKKVATKSVSSKSKSTKKTKKELPSYSPEYYDLPYKYNQTVVKILAQTPTNLFVYWEISDEDRANLKQKYGEYFFEITKPVLVVYNETLNYSFEIDINDFANSWYLHVNDSNCQYKIELGRRPIPINYSYIPQYNLEKNGPLKPVEAAYVYISSSNGLETPNDHILYNKQNKLFFRNIKTNQIIEKDIKDFPFIVKNNTFISLYELYADLYKEEILNHRFDLNNPSSGNPGSGSLSSKFK